MQVTLVGFQIFSWRLYLLELLLGFTVNLKPKSIAASRNTRRNLYIFYRDSTFLSYGYISKSLWIDFIRDHTNCRKRHVIIQRYATPIWIRIGTIIVLLLLLFKSRERTTNCLRLARWVLVSFLKNRLELKMQPSPFSWWLWFQLVQGMYHQTHFQTVYQTWTKVILYHQLSPVLGS